MANFGNLSTDCVNVVAQCANNNNKQDMAIFVITQDRIIREENIKRKYENANNNNTNNSTNNSNNSNNMSDRRMQALNRLKAHMK